MKPISKSDEKINKILESYRFELDQIIEDMEGYSGKKL